MLQIRILKQILVSRKEILKSFVCTRLEKLSKFSIITIFFSGFSGLKSWLFLLTCNCNNAIYPWWPDLLNFLPWRTKSHKIRGKIWVWKYDLFGKHELGRRRTWFEQWKVVLKSNQSKKGSKGSKIKANKNMDEKEVGFSFDKWLLSKSAWNITLKKWAKAAMSRPTNKWTKSKSASALSGPWVNLL